MRNYAHKTLYVLGLTFLTVILVYTPTEKAEQRSKTVATATHIVEERDEKNSSVSTDSQASKQESKGEQPSTPVTTQQEKVTDIGTPETKPPGEDVIDGFVNKTPMPFAVATYQLNVRKDPNPQSPIITTLNKGDIVVAIEKLSNGWLKLKTGGYINAKYVVPAKDEGVTKKLTSRSKERAVMAASLTAPKNVSLKVSEQSNLTPEQLNQILEGTGLEGLGHAFIKMEEKYNVNALFGVAVAKLESAHGTSRLARNKNNLFGLNAIDGDAYNKAFSYRTKEECILAFGEIIQTKYLDQGRTTLHQINKKYAPYNDAWATKVSSIMRSDANKINNQ